jgi:ATP-dependent exoDNAse (exonuclease V) beta subunit
MTATPPGGPGEILPLPPEIILPRELVLASAGTGKTFALSSRMIGLLRRGVPPESLLASTFTRKAAGEILARVLSRLAKASLDPIEAETLALHTHLGPETPAQDPAGSQAEFSSLLRSLVDRLHRVNVGTMDALFVRIAGTFANELGMPPAWAVGDEPTAQRLESEALQKILAAAAPSETAELVRMTMRGESSRGVHHRLLGQLRELRSLLHQGGRGEAHDIWASPAPGPYEEAEGAGPDPTWESILISMAGAPLPVTAKGRPDGRFQGAVRAGVEALRARDWDGFCEKGLGAKILAGEDRYYGKPIPPELTQAYRRALGKTSRALRGELAAQARALRDLVLGFDGALSELQRREGAYRFEDITYLLAGGGVMGSTTDLWYRLDQRAHHLLLDEFQDTSRPQWEALEPLAAELLSGHGEERSALVVADPKQSIYGWRGAEPSLAGQVGRRFGLQKETLTRSFRSSAPVLELVNEVFGSLPENPLWDREPDLRGAVEEWSSGFPVHTPALELPGQVTLEVGPRDPEAAGSDRPALMARAASRIGEIHRRSPGITVGVLVRRNASVAHLMAHLRILGIEASEEGATTLTDSPVVATCLALLRLADHPGDPLARFQVARSPLGEVVGLPLETSATEARRAARQIRRDLLVRGYGEVINGWTRTLRKGGAVVGRESRRLLQLVELAYRWDARSTLRPGDFGRWVEAETVEAPTGAPVRVMTVHKAKGLEFDLVVLPELETRLVTGGGLYQAVLPLRDRTTGEVRRIFPHLKRSLRPLFPDIQEAGSQDRERELHDALGVVYVALTRAKHALHLFLEADPPGDDPKISFTPSGLLRHALGLEATPLREGARPMDRGDEDWASHRSPGRREPSRPRFPEKDTRPEPFELRDSGPRTRLLPHRTPSSVKPPGPGTLRQILTLGGNEGRRIGTVIHTWLESLIWLEDWAPRPEDLLASGREAVPDLSEGEADALRVSLEGWLAREAVASALRRTAYPPDSLALTEEPFVVRLEDEVYQGRVDRLVLVLEGHRPVAAEVMDYKTDQLEAGDPEEMAEARRRYAGQVQIYRRAVASMFDLPLKKVSGTLLFLVPGAVARLPI